MPLYDFLDGNGLVPASQHVNPDGLLGGWVADTAWVAPTVNLGERARVYGNASVCGDSVLTERVQVLDEAKVVDSHLGGEAKIYGNARVEGSSTVTHRALVSGDATVTGSSKVLGSTTVSGNVLVTGSSILTGGAVNGAPGGPQTELSGVRTFDGGEIDGWVIVKDSSVRGSIRGTAHVTDTALGRGSEIYDKAVVNRTTLTGDSRVFGHAVVENSSLCGGAAVFGRARVERSDLKGNVAVSGDSQVSWCALSGYVRVVSRAQLKECSLSSHVAVNGDSVLSHVTAAGEFYFEDAEVLFVDHPPLYGRASITGQGITEISCGAVPGTDLHWVRSVLINEVRQLGFILTDDPCSPDPVLVAEDEDPPDETGDLLAVERRLFKGPPPAPRILTKRNASYPLSVWQKALPDLKPTIQALILMLSHD